MVICLYIDSLSGCVDLHVCAAAHHHWVAASFAAGP